MATSGQEILSYTGSGGLGSNSDVPAVPTVNLDVINQTATRLMEMNAARNLNLYQQKIKDRDNLYAALDSGDVQVGDILERDQPTVKEGLDKLDEAYFKRVKKGINDLDAAAEYKKAFREAKDRVSQAQARKVYYDTENGSITKETLPSKQEARKKNMEGSLSNFWGDIKPYVPALDLNHPQMNTSVLRDALVPKSGIPGGGTATTQWETVTTKDGKKVLKQTTKTAPIKPGSNKMASTGIGGQPSLYNTIPGKFYDYNKIAANASDDFLHDEAQRNNQMLWLKSVQEDSPIEAKKVIDYTNSRIEQYNRERGLAQGQPGYVGEVDLVIDPNGRLHINETPAQFAAKTALASIPGNFVEEDKQELNKDVSDRDLRLRALANDRATLGLRWAEFNYAADGDKFGASSVLNEAKGIIDKGVETKIEIGGGKTKTVLRVGDPTLMKQFGNIDKEGNVTNVPDVIEYDRNSDQVKLVYYDEEKTASGKNVISKEVSLDQRTWLKEIAKRSFPNKDIGKVNTLVDDILNKNGNSLYKLTQSGAGKPAINLSQYDIPNGAKVVYGKDGNPLGYELNGKKFKFE